MFCHIYYFYYLSLESCFDGEGPCSSYIKWIKKKSKTRNNFLFIIDYNHTINFI